MFSKLSEDIKRLNAGVSDAANSEKARALRKKLLTTGAVMCAVGWGGVFVCFLLFATAGMAAFGDNGFTARVIVPFVLFMPFAFIGAVGMMLLRLGFSVLAGGVTSKFIDETVNRRCECGNTVSADDKFCPRCGRPMKRKCPSCGTEQPLGAAFCNECGARLGGESGE